MRGTTQPLGLRWGFENTSNHLLEHLLLRAQMGSKILWDLKTAAIVKDMPKTEKNWRCFTPRSMPKKEGTIAFFCAPPSAN